MKKSSLKKRLSLFLKLLAGAVFVAGFLSVAWYGLVFYSTAIPEVTTPDVTGLTTQEARAKLESLNLRAEIALEKYSKEVLPGRVMSQRPEGGRRVKEGRIVGLVISQGARQVVVPNVLGRPLEQVKIVLKEEGLRVGKVRHEFMGDYPAGTIIDQEPLPQARVDFGVLVDIVVTTTLESEFEPASPAGGEVEEDE